MCECGDDGFESGGDVEYGGSCGDGDAAHLTGQQCHESGSGTCSHSLHLCSSPEITSPLPPLANSVPMHGCHLPQSLMWGDGTTTVSKIIHQVPYFSSNILYRVYNANIQHYTVTQTYHPVV